MALDDVIEGCALMRDRKGDTQTLGPTQAKHVLRAAVDRQQPALIETYGINPILY